MAAYIGVIHKDEYSDFGVSFPDFPGCVTAGKSLDEAASMAKEALAGHIEVMRDEGEAPPIPSGLESAQAHEFAQAAVAFIVVDVPVPQSRSVKVSITVPEDDLANIDRFAKNHGMARSTFLVQAARKAMRG